MSSHRVLTLMLSLAAIVMTLPLLVAQPADDDFVRQRKELAHRPRRVILNNDGCDVLYFPKGREVTAQNLLDLRTTALAGTHVDAVFYCTISSGFSYFTHNTRVGTVLDRNMDTDLNVARPLIEQGADALKVMVDFCHSKGMELFWSMRMNDTHDAAHRPDKPYPLFPPLKAQHPEYLVGAFDNRPPHGPWSSVDYGRPEIRDLAFRFIEEVCQGYDVDGVELDFFRHLCYFKSVAFGGQASEAELEMMTDLLRRVRAMADAEGRKRGRPILIAVRVPDSVEYCRAIGLDLERWLSEGLVDLLVGSGYFQLNPWEYLVALGHRFGVAVYPSLDESRVQGDVAPFGRNSPQAYRGRALRAWQAGADGIYLFNFFNPKAPMLREIGDPQALTKLERVYFATVRDGDPNAYLADGRRFRNTPVLTPSAPLPVQPGETRVVEVAVGDDLLAQAQTGARSEATLHLLASTPERVTVALNGAALGQGRAAGKWWAYAVPATALRAGMNQVELSAPPAEARSHEVQTWDTVWTGAALPEGPWYRDPARETTVAEVRDGALLLADRGKDSGDYLYFYCPWGTSPAVETVAEVRVKVISGWNNIILSNGKAIERVTLYPDHIGTYHSGLRCDLVTTDDFHTYRIVLKGDDLLVYVDDELRLDARGRFTEPSPAGRNAIQIGAANSGEVGEALWQSVRFRTPVVTVYDLVVAVRPEGGR